MKFDKKAKYEYENNGINEENGYTKWYNKKSPVKSSVLQAHILRLLWLPY